MSKYAIQVKDVRKQFSYTSHKNNSIKRAITQLFKPKDTSKETFYALDGVSFNVEKGDFFGILGRNGSGKSTLLKIISEIYQPTSGSVQHEGKIVSFIELGVGFKAELTGRENVYLNAALLGFSKTEIDAMYDDIVSFAELEDFMDQQLKNYSSGMKVRLAFSVAIRAKADVLVLDEVLAVGDAAFRKKCNKYFEKLKNDNKTVILVTHGMGNVRQFCNKAIVIDGGRIVYEGEANEAADAYLDLFNSDSDSKDSKRQGTGAVRVENFTVEKKSDGLFMSITAKAEEEVSNVKLAVIITNENGKVIAGTNSMCSKNGQKLTFGQGETKTITFSSLNTLGKGKFSVGVRIEKIGGDVYDVYNNVAIIENDPRHVHYPTTLPSELQIEKT